MIPKRKYYNLKESAEKTGIPVDELLHYGETGQVQLYVSTCLNHPGRECLKTGINDYIDVYSAPRSCFGNFPIYQLDILQIKKGKHLSGVFIETKPQERVFFFDEPVLFSVDDLRIMAEDVDALISNKTEPPQQDTPQSRKRESNLLKVIGGLIRTNYLQKYSGTYWKGDKPNISAIAEAFQNELSKAGYSDEGFQDSSLRKTITDALERIEENKNS